MLKGQCTDGKMFETILARPVRASARIAIEKAGNYFCGRGENLPGLLIIAKFKEVGTEFESRFDFHDSEWGRGRCFSCSFFMFENSDSYQPPVPFDQLGEINRGSWKDLA